MRAILRKILAILDGTPTGRRGQSLVELTLTLPILMVMILGLTEIGWYANNYLTLLDVVREAGRFGATRDPLSWVDGEELKYHRMDCEEEIALFDKRDFDNKTTWPGPDLSAWGYSAGDERPIGFYDGVACSVIRCRCFNISCSIAGGLTPRFASWGGCPLVRTSARTTMLMIPSTGIMTAAAVV